MTKQLFKQTMAIVLFTSFAITVTGQEQSETSESGERISIGSFIGEWKSVKNNLFLFKLEKGGEIYVKKSGTQYWALLDNKGTNNYEASHDNVKYFDIELTSPILCKITSYDIAGKQVGVDECMKNDVDSAKLKRTMKKAEKLNQ